MPSQSVSAPPGLLWRVPAWPRAAALHLQALVAAVLVFQGCQRRAPQAALKQ